VTPWIIVASSVYAVVVKLPAVPTVLAVSCSTDPTRAAATPGSLASI